MSSQEEAAPVVEVEAAVQDSVDSGPVGTSVDPPDSHVTAEPAHDVIVEVCQLMPTAVGCVLINAHHRVHSN